MAGEPLAQVAEDELGRVPQRPRPQLAPPGPTVASMKPSTQSAMVRGGSP